MIPKKKSAWISFIVFTLVIVSLLGGVFIHPSGALAQEGGEEPALRLDGAVSPEAVKPGEEIQLNLSLVGNPDVCSPVETRKPLDIILSVDRSSSMDSQLGEGGNVSKLEGALSAIDSFVDLINPKQDQLGLVVFAAGNGEILTSLGTSVEVKEQLINVKKDSGFFEGGTNVEAGIRRSIEIISENKRPHSNPVIILLTDGVEGGGSNSRSAADEAKEDGIRMITIGLGPDVDEKLLRELATNPIDYYYAPNTSDLEGIYVAIERNIQVFNPADDIRVTYRFDASNFELIEESITPAPTEISVNTIIWEFETIEDSAKRLFLSLKARVPGTYFALLGVEVDYLACGKTPITIERNNQYKVEVVSGESTEEPLCAGVEDPGQTGLLSTVCSPIPWGALAGLLIFLLLFLVWLSKTWPYLRAKIRCGLPIPICSWMRLLTWIGLAILLGAMLTGILNSVCEAKEGIIFWRVLPDRQSALFLKPTKPNVDSRALTAIVEEDQCIGCHITNIDNQSMASISQGTNGILTFHDLKGEPISSPAIQGSYPTWSPDGKFLAYAANNQDIFILNAETGVSAPLEGASEPGVIETMPDWSPDGDRIAFVRAAGADQNITITTPSDILSISAEGGRPILVPGASGVGFNYHPRYSPDGKWMAFVHHENGNTTYGDPKAEVYLVPTGGGAPRRLQANDGPGRQPIPGGGGNTYPTWSLDGNYLRFSSRRCGGQYDIYQTKIDNQGGSGPAERLSTISDPEAFEFSAQEVVFNRVSIWDRLRDLWPWSIPLLLSLIASYLLCRPKSPAKEKSTIKPDFKVTPQEGWLEPRQRFNVTVELVGDPICERIALQRNVDVVLLIDSSGSMSAHDMGVKNRLEIAKKSAVRFVNCVVSDQERVAVANFDNMATIQQGLTSDKAMINKAIEKINIAGATNLYDGLEKASLILERNKRNDAIQVIILLSDGMPTNDSQGSLILAENMRNKGVRIMSVGIGEANADYLRAISGESGQYKYASDEKGLAEAFLEVGRQLIMPTLAKDIVFTHTYDHEKFELLLGSVKPQPDRVRPGSISWKVDELTTQPVYFGFVVKPKVFGNHNIDILNEFSYQRCGDEDNRRKLELASMLNVKIKEVEYVSFPPVELPPVQKIKLQNPDPVWQPDQALFIGIGGAGRWVLTNIKKNLLDAAIGEIPEGIQFLVVDTDEKEKIQGEEAPVEIANVKLAKSDIYVLDENLSGLVKAWSGKNTLLPEHRGWFSPRDYQGLDEELNLANGTFGRRALPRVALLRNLQDVGQENSRWQKKQVENNQPRLIREVLKDKLQKTYQKEEDKLRIFLVGSLAGGMSGLLVDIVNLTRQLASGIVSQAGSVSIEGYLMDGVPYEGLPGGPRVGQQRLSNSFASLREISRWQLNPGYALNPRWGDENKPDRLGMENKLIQDVIFDDLVLFSGKKGGQGALELNLYPAVSDVVTARLDRATGAGADADWFNQMRKARTDRHRKEHHFTVSTAGAYTLRLPIYDILRSLHARWSYRLVRKYFAGGFEKEIEFNLNNTGYISFTSNPSDYIPYFLYSGSDIEQEVPSESQVLGDLLLGGETSLLENENVISAAKVALNKPQNDIEMDVKVRLGKMIEIMLIGDNPSPSVGSRAARLEYATKFLESFEVKMGALRAKLEGDPELSSVAKVAGIYQHVGQEQFDKLNRFKQLLVNQDGQGELGLIQKLEQLAIQLENTQDDLAKIESRKYFWGENVEGPNGSFEEKLFVDTWWQKYLKGKIDDHLDYIGWVIEDGNLDLEIRLEENPVRLLRDGTDSMMDCIMQMAETLTVDVWDETSLAEVLLTDGLLESNPAGKEAFRHCDSENIVNVRGDTGMPLGRVLMIAPNSVHDISKNKPFIEGIKGSQSKTGIGMMYKDINSTDRLSSSLLFVLDAIRLDKSTGYALSEREYDTLNQWSDVHRRYADGAGTVLAVMRADAEARKLELCKDFLHGDQPTKLHPLVVSALENPERAELFCLAIAEEIIIKDPKGKIIAKNPMDQTVYEILDSEREAVDIYVDALIKWSLDVKNPAWAGLAEALRKRYDQQNPFESGFSWINGPQRKFIEKSIPPERTSMGILVSTLIRHYFRTKERRWKDG